MLFRRSWTTRTGVERVMGFCTPQEEALFCAGCPIFEQMLIDGARILLRKYWFSVSEDEATAPIRVPGGRPAAALEAQPDGPRNPSTAGVSRAKDGMMVHDTPTSPWFVVEWRSRRTPG